MIETSIKCDSCGVTNAVVRIERGQPRGNLCATCALPAAYRKEQHADCNFRDPDVGGDIRAVLRPVVAGSGV